MYVVCNSVLGTVTHIYLTSDGGADLSLLYSMVAQLDEHVQIVDHRTLAKMAIAASAVAAPVQVKLRDSDDDLGAPALG
jgi:hypothetical protein